MRKSRIKKKKRITKKMRVMRALGIYNSILESASHVLEYELDILGTDLCAIDEPMWAELDGLTDFADARAAALAIYHSICEITPDSKMDISWMSYIYDDLVSDECQPYIMVGDSIPTTPEQLYKLYVATYLISYTDPICMFGASGEAEMAQVVISMAVDQINNSEPLLSLADFTSIVNVEEEGTPKREKEESSWLMPVLAAAGVVGLASQLLPKSINKTKKETVEISK